MDPSIAKKKPRKRKAPAPPNPFTGQIETDNRSETSIELDVTEEDEVYYMAGWWEMAVIYRPCHAKTCLRPYADSQSPDQCTSAQSDQGLHIPRTDS